MQDALNAFKYIERTIKAYRMYTILPFLRIK